jgi:hypothetical protein
MLRKNLDDLIENGKVGDWCFSQDDTILWLRYPTNTSDDFLPIVQLYVTPSKKNPCWDFDGNKNNPTLSPSIEVKGKWHGFLRNGKLITV